MVVGLYTPERSIIDTYRLAHVEGTDVAHQAFAAVAAPRRSAGGLLTVAASFPRTLPALRRVLEVLL